MVNTDATVQPAEQPAKKKQFSKNKKTPASTRRDENRKASKEVKTSEESLVFESAFATELSFIPTHREIEFSPSAIGWIPTTELAYSELCKEIQTSKELPLEAFNYYSAGLFWLRAIGLKFQNLQEITDVEYKVHRAFDGKTLCIPEPLYFGLKMIGNTTTKNGECLAPTFPPLPTTVIDQIPGTLGVVSTENHNVYEELPVMGPVYEACVKRVANRKNSLYASSLVPQGTTANVNLQGFHRLTTARPDSLVLLENINFQGDRGPRTIGYSGISYERMKAISNVLTRTTSFKNFEVFPLTIPVTGSIAQIIEMRPSAKSSELEETVTARDTPVTAQCYSKESMSHIGISVVFGLNQWKVTLPEPLAAEPVVPVPATQAQAGAAPAQPAASFDNNRIASWSCVTFTPAVPPPDGYIVSANNRRTLPCRFSDRVFHTAVMIPQDERLMTISRLAKHTT